MTTRHVLRLLSLVLVAAASLKAQTAGKSPPGTVGDGKTDDSAALSRACVAGREVWLQPGASYVMERSVSLGCVLHFVDGARLVVGSGVRVVLTGAVQAAAAPIFAVSGTGSVVFGTPSGMVPVEWFGAAGDGDRKTAAGTDNTAAIQRAIDAVQVQGTVQLQCRTYVISGTLRISRSSVNFYGGECEGLAGAQSILLEKSATADILDLHSATGTMQWNRLRTLALMRAVVPAGHVRGLSLDNVGGYDVDHVSSEDSGVNFYYHAAPNYGVGSSRFLHAGWGYGEVHAYPNGSDLVGYDLNSEDGQAENSVSLSGAGASSNLGAGVTTTAIFIHGTAINDVNVDGVGSAGTTFGAVIRYTGSGGGFSGDDIIVTDSSFDNFSGAGIVVQGVPGSALGAINFNGGYVLQFSGGARGKCAIAIQNSSGVTITGMQIGNAAGSGVCLQNAQFAKVLGNTIHKTEDAAISGTGLRHSVIAENTLEGPGRVGISLDAASGGNAVAGNIVDPAKDFAVQDLSGDGANGGSSPAAVPVGVAAGAAVKAEVSAGVAQSAEAWAAATDRAFTVSFKAEAAAALATDAHLLHVRFGKTWVNVQGQPELPYCTFSPRSAAAGGLSLFLSAGSRDLLLDAVAPLRLVAGQTYAWTVRCEGDGER